MPFSLFRSSAQVRQLTARLEAAESRAGELKDALAAAREEMQRWKKKAGELSQQLEQFEKAAERLPRVERDLADAKDRITKLRDLKHALVRVERNAALSQEHLLATETKLDIIEGALAVLDRRTRVD